MINDTVDYGEWKTENRTTGLVNNASSFGMKVGDRYWYRINRFATGFWWI